MKGSIKRKQRQLDLDHMLGTQLAKLRKTHELRQVDIAKRMDFQRSLVSKIETGDRSLGAMEIRDYAEALGIEPSELYEVIDAIVCEYNGAGMNSDCAQDGQATDAEDDYSSCL